MAKLKETITEAVLTVILIHIGSGLYDLFGKVIAKYRTPTTK